MESNRPLGNLFVLYAAAINKDPAEILQVDGLDNLAISSTQNQKDGDISSSISKIAHVKHLQWGRDLGR